MKKYGKLALMFVLIVVLALSSTALAKDAIRVRLNGVTLEFDVDPQIINDRTMVPLRGIFEALGAEVEWNGGTRTVSAVKGNKVVVATIDSRIMYINDEERIMDVAPMIINDRTLVPVRFVAEAFDCDVKWDAGKRMVIIETDEEIGYIGLPDDFASKQEE